MVSTEAVAGYIQQLSDANVTELSMHKLLYYVQAWSATCDGVPLLDERFEAWRLGPVAVRWRDSGRLEGDDFSGLDARAREIIETIVTFYGRYTPGELVASSHAEAPWMLARTGIAATERSNAEISVAEMRAFYTRQSLSAESPTPPVPVRTATPSVQETLALARTHRAKWAGTLDRLAYR